MLISSIIDTLWFLVRSLDIKVKFLYFYFRHHVYKKNEGGKDIELNEVGPRFEMQCKYILLFIVHSYIGSFTQILMNRFILSLEIVESIEEENISCVPNISH